jgi:putative acetyltransferase
LCDALETLAKARGAGTITVEASETAVEFFEARDYTATERNSVERFGEWLATTTMKKTLNDEPAERSEDSDDGEA